MAAENPMHTTTIGLAPTIVRRMSAGCKHDFAPFGETDNRDLTLSEISPALR